MSPQGLFRPEVFENRKNKYYGTVLINTPIHYLVVTCGVSSLVMGVFLWIVLGDYSQKFLVTGYVASTAGIAKIYPHKNGVILQSFVQPGSVVKQGDRLFLLDTSDEGLGKKNRHYVLIALRKKKQLLTAQIAYKEQHLQVLKRLLEKKYITLSAYHEKRDDLLALQRQKGDVDTEVIRYQQDASHVVVSPVDGLVASVIYKRGQQTHSGKPLAMILPKDSDWVAEIFVPVKQAGFLYVGQQIEIRYDAYPYTHFGTSEATIDDVSQSVLTDDEDDKPIRIGQPYYKVTAHFNKSFITVYGKKKVLQHGMTFSAVMVGSKKKIWQWIFDPIYRFHGGSMA